MRKLLNDKERVVDEMVEGFLAAHADIVTGVPGQPRVVVRRALEDDRVGVVIGGGSGHEPAFMGFVGPGMADAAPVGNIFSSPPVDPIVAAGERVDRGRGLVFIYGNYAGDVMNFGLAQDMLRDDGHQVDTVLVTDDVASAPRTESERRRGIAGVLPVFKVAGAAAAEGAGLAAVAAAATRANRATRSMGVALAPCILPHTGLPSFTLDAGQMEVGLGIHGEPGVGRRPLASADETADLLLDPVLAELDAGPGDEVAVWVNGLGATPQMELYLVARRVLSRLADMRTACAVIRVGNFVTSLEMAGCSVTLTRLDADLRRWLTAPARAPGYWA